MQTVMKMLNDWRSGRRAAEEERRKNRLQDNRLEAADKGNRAMFTAMEASGKTHFDNTYRNMTRYSTGEPFPGVWKVTYERIEE